MREMITVEKEVYEAVLRNSVRVNDLEAENEQLKKDIRYGFAVDGIVMEKMDKINAENQQLKAALGKQCLKDDMIEQLLAHQTIAIILVKLCKAELKKIDTDSAKDLCQKIDQFIKQAIGVKR